MAWAAARDEPSEGRPAARYDGQPNYDGEPNYGGQPGYGGQPHGAGSPYGGTPGTPYGDGSAAPYGGARYQPGPASYGGDPYRDAAADPYAGDAAKTPGKRGRGPLIAVLAVVVLLLVAGGGTLWFLSGQDEPDPAAAPTESAAGAEPSEPAAPAPSEPAPESSADPRFVKVGQCVRNEGTAGSKPKLLISDCAPKSYEVLRRIDGATSGEKDAEAKCAKVEGYTNWYFFDSELDTLDFVLCLKQR